MKTRQSRITGPRRGEALGPLDPREHAWRSDLADIALAGKVAVPNYAEPVLRAAMVPAPVLAAPAAAMASELLPGEEFAVLEERDGYCWGYALSDHYVGYVEASALGPGPAIGIAGKVGPGDGLLFREPDLKAPTVGTLPLGAIVRYEESEGDGGKAGPFLRLVAGAGAGCYLHRRHLLREKDGDWVAVAMRFLGAPYRWGGRTRHGIDCSGLVQVARQLAGHHCRRDSDMIAADAAPLPAGADICRGDLAFWPGHIGIMLDQATILHANAHHMAVVVEPVADVARRAAERDTAEHGAPSFRRCR